MENNIKVSRAHRILAVFYGTIAVFWLVLFVFTIASEPRNADNWAVIFLPILLFAMTALHIYAAKGAYVKNNTARIVSMVIGGLMILGFPIGTIIGVYLLTNSQSWNTTPITLPVNNSPADPGVWPPPPTSSTV